MTSSPQIYVAPTSDTDIYFEYPSECPICFDGLHDKPCSVLHNAEGTRVCLHVFHQECAELVLQQSLNAGAVCPICRAPFTKVVPLPSLLSDPRGWFEASDLDKDGKLTTDEARVVLESQFPLTLSQKGWDSVWKVFDKNSDGYVTYDELVDPGSGVIAYVRKHYGRDGSNLSSGEAPDIRSNRRAWFLHWDDDGNGTLTRDEIIRALVKTFKISSDHERVDTMRNTVDSVFGIFDPDGSGTINIDEFSATDGLGDTIVASLVF
eukprot:CAMPEP_0185740962 /NCGR_PEP_ID=MMETSP1171-20130828/38704_1 /TAXON_ID=374046 /ORGANISM="Helicotheca tamensis, Strain CCMP826" /LENGTH=263 /DNA_ID=CAMNT_0028412899 /DNA_START=463 /DNA_END=1254 /DNA_ORIENTATION=-